VQIKFDMFADQKKFAEIRFAFDARKEEALQTGQTHIPTSNGLCNIARADQLFDQRHWVSI
jgi:hypothetical protein